MRTTTPAVSSSGRLWRKRDASAGPPAQRMENLPGVDHRPQPVAVFGGALHRQQQRQQFVAVCRPGVFAQRLAQRDVLGAGLSGEARRVGRHEGERLFGVAAVLRQVEMHAADQVPGRVQRVEEALQAGAGSGERGGEGLRQFVPQRQQDRRRSGIRRPPSSARSAPARQVRPRSAAGRPEGWRAVGSRAGRVQAERPDVAGGEVRATRRRPAAGPARPRRRPAAPGRGRTLGRRPRSGGSRTAASISGASSWSSATRRPCGVRRNPSRGHGGSLAGRGVRDRYLRRGQQAEMATPPLEFMTLTRLSLSDSI